MSEVRMNVRSSMTKCAKCGKPYDGAVHAACPYCGGGFMPTEAPGGFTPTEAPVNAGGGAFPHTCPPTGVPSAEDYGSGGFVETQIGGFSSEALNELVVGWLVCVEGPARGLDYRLHAGYNYIGREKGDIRIQGDLQISHEKHAMIAYDSSEQLYFMGPSSGANIIKVNGKTIIQAVELKNYDMISIGTTKFIFVGLCGPQFDWEKRGSNG